MKQKKTNEIMTMLFLHILLLVYSTTGVLSKLASREPLLSVGFCLYYGLMLIVLALYAIGWQQIIKRIPLTIAYANRSITTVWVCFWGVIIFGESLSIGKIVGLAIIVIGAYMYTTDRIGESNVK